MNILPPLSPLVAQLLSWENLLIWKANNNFIIDILVVQLVFTLLGWLIWCNLVSIRCKDTLFFVMKITKTLEKTETPVHESHVSHLNYFNDFVHLIVKEHICYRDFAPVVLING